ncbi:glycerate kinase family protein [Paenibacillus sp. y28]|uniref:glycerate kinase family protein n=1 Tax=Paenibacillus sp. y28 TaxID=3129110 RepID=UPI00301ADEDD
MNIVVAPDAFKGSLSAREICAAVEAGIRRVVPQAKVHSVPLADGGEGTMDNLVFASKGTIQRVQVKGPLGKPVDAAYGILGDGRTVVIEMAQASGLPLVPAGDRNPLLATSYGTGEMMKHALDAGYRHFVVGLGGSATNDAGAGLLRALGLQLYDESGAALPDGGGALAQLAAYDETRLDARLKDCTFTAACDVTNTLCGAEGASAVFGPQKGATPDMVLALDQALNRFADIVRARRGSEIRDIVGGGAAGGIGAALVAFLGASIRSGIEVVMEQLKLDELLQTADLVITGEGRLDAQTLSGKVIAGVSRAAQAYHVPVIALCGSLDLSPAQLDELKLLTACSIVPGPCRLEDAIAQAPGWITERTELIMRLIRHYRG